MLGDTSARCVSEGNCMAARCALLCFLALARGIWVVMEQPRGSLLEHHPAMQLLLKLCQFWRKSIKMGDFAAPSQKDTWLYSSLGPNCYRCVLLGFYPTMCNGNCMVWNISMDCGGSRTLHVGLNAIWGIMSTHDESNSYQMVVSIINWWGILGTHTNRVMGDLSIVYCLWAIQLISSLSGQPFIEQIYDFKPATLPQRQSVQLVEKYVDSKGINRVKGSRFLKRSQAYTRQFLRLLDWS